MRDGMYLSGRSHTHPPGSVDRWSCRARFHPTLDCVWHLLARGLRKTFCDMQQNFRQGKSSASAWDFIGQLQ